MPFVENEIINEIPVDIVNEPVHLDQIDNKIISEELSISKGDDKDTTQKIQNNSHNVEESQEETNLDEIHPDSKKNDDTNRCNFRQKRAQIGDFERMYYVQGNLALHVSIKQGLNEFGEAGKVSVIAELKQMIDKKVCKPIKFNTLSKEQTLGKYFRI
jgi:hypothetical protein